MGKRGFTLIELLIVVSIITIFTALLLPNLKRGEEVFALQRAAYKLSRDLRMASNMAVSGKITPPSFPPGGYGIYFFGTNTQEYILFRDQNNNKFYDSGEEIGENLKLQEKGVLIETISPSFPLSVVFTPPDPSVTIKTASLNFSQAEIILKQRNQRLGVRVNSVGLIEIFEL